jgi:hypothetical protein
MPFFSKPWWQESGHAQCFSKFCRQTPFFSECWYFQLIWSQTMLYYHKILVRESGLQCAWSKGCSQWPNCNHFLDVCGLNHFLKKMEMCNQKMGLFKLYASQSKLITLHSSELYSQDSTVFREEHNESNNISIQDITVDNKYEYS